MCTLRHRENLCKKMYLQNLKTKDQFDEYGQCRTVGDIKMDLKKYGEHWIQVMQNSIGLYWRSLSKNARTILIDKMIKLLLIIELTTFKERFCFIHVFFNMWNYSCLLE
jgi:hypothetical protein